MDLNSRKHEFERTKLKQMLSFLKTYLLIDHVEQVIELALEELKKTGTDTGSNVTTMFAELRREMDRIDPVNEMKGSQEDLAVALDMYSDILEKHFNLGISETFMNIDWDNQTLNQIIAGHFYRHGMTDVGDTFIKEANQLDATSELRSQFVEMNQILEAMSSSNLGHALDWAAREREHLSQNGSNVEMKLHSLRFLQLLQKGKRNEALQYSREHISAFARKYPAEFQKLMACLLWTGQLNKSPYVELFSPSRWEELAGEIERQFCNKLEQPYGSPLSMAVAAGVQMLPDVLDCLGNEKTVREDGSRELLLKGDLPPEFQIYSFLYCPATEYMIGEKAPMVTPCGHFVDKKMLVDSDGHYKCDMCRHLNITTAQCKPVYL